MSTNSSINVLVAEDDALINDRTAKQLQRLGYALAGRAYDGRQAVELTCECHPGVVIMDLQMIDPDTGQEDPQAGFKATRAIQEQAPTAVVILTAHESPDLFREAGSAGASGYVVKPADDIDLDRAITIARARFEDLQALRRLSEELGRRNEELLAAQTRIKTLSGLLPICSSCKRIRDDHGRWHEVEVYVRDHSDADFSHGLCPNCVSKYFPSFPADGFNA